MKKFYLFAVMFIGCLSHTFIHAEDNSEPSEKIIFNRTPHSSKKRMPPRYTSYLTYQDGEACFHSTQPYAYATIVVTDETDNVISSMIVSPEDNCNSLELLPGCTITCTFDNGASLCATY